MLLPDILAPKIKQALQDMGADITQGHGNLFQGLFNDRFVVCYQRGDFCEIICKHEPTYNQILQIVSLLAEPKE